MNKPYHKEGHKMYTNQSQEKPYKIKLSPQEIIDNEFKKGIKGYSAEEVDLFLDTVIEDYMTYQKMLDQLKKENEQLKIRIKEMSQQPKVAMPSTNLDVLQRLSNLERHVFGDRLRRDL